MFLSQTWMSVRLVRFHFIFVTRDDVVIYLHENMRIKQLLLKRLFGPVTVIITLDKYVSFKSQF